MKIIENALIIPPAILALADVNASEKMLLSLYLANPKSTNRQALQILGMGLSGLKKLKGRLLAKGLLRCKASGHQVQVPGLPEPKHDEGHLVTNPVRSEKDEKVAAPRKIKSVEEIQRGHNERIEMVTSGPFHPSTLLLVSSQTLEQIEADVPKGPLKDALVANFTTRCNAWFVLNYVEETLPESFHMSCKAQSV